MPGTHRARPIPYLSSPPGSYAAGTITVYWGGDWAARWIWNVPSWWLACKYANLRACPMHTLRSVFQTCRLPVQGRLQEAVRVTAAAHTCAHTRVHTHSDTQGRKGAFTNRVPCTPVLTAPLPLAPEAAATEQGAGKRRLHDRLSALSPSPVPSTPDFRPLL